MLYEFALTPAVFGEATLGSDPAKQLIVIQLLRGLLRNGLLADLHKGEWHRNVARQVEALPQALRAKIIACLSALDSRRRIVRHPKGRSDPACEHDWLLLAVEEHRKFGFQGIVRPDGPSAHETLESAPIMPLTEALDSPRWLEIADNQTPSVPTTDMGYRRMLGPLVRYAKKFELIDRYLTPHEPRFFHTVKICMELLRQDPRGFRQIPVFIHAGDPENDRKDHYPEAVEARLRAWEESLSCFITKDWPYRFEVSLWQDPSDRRASMGQRFHDRYILTDQCAVSVQSGLDCSGDPENLTTWSMLDEKQRLHISSLVNPPTSPWKKLGQKRIACD